MIWSDNVLETCNQRNPGCVAVAALAPHYGPSPQHGCCLTVEKRRHVTLQRCNRYQQMQLSLHLPLVVPIFNSQYVSMCVSCHTPSCVSLSKGWSHPISHVLCRNAKCSTDLSIEIDTSCDATSHKTRQQKEPRIRRWLMQSRLEIRVLAESVWRNTRNSLTGEHSPSEQRGDGASNRSKELKWTQLTSVTSVSLALLQTVLHDMSCHKAD